MESQHILGSAQVLVETDNTRIVYSSDFSYPGTKPVICDILVLDSTHGSSRFDAYADSTSLKERLTDLVDCEIQAGKSITIRAHVGRLQHIMSVLSEKFPDIPFLANTRNKKLVSVYRKYGMPITDIINLNSIDGEKIIDSSSMFIDFKSNREGESTAEIDKRSAVFNIGGRYLGHHTSIQERIDKSGTPTGIYDLELGDHANYPEILEYVRQCKSSLVITDYFRSKQCKVLSENITQELGIKSTPQPKKPHT